MAQNKHATGKIQQQPRHRQVPLTNKEQLQEQLSWFLPDDAAFAGIEFHGNVTWRPTALVWLALVWAWLEARYLTDAFSDAVDSCHKMLGSVALTTYQGFMGALVSWTSKLLPRLQRVVQQRMEQLGSKWWRVGGWVAIAFDGSRSSASRTEANEAALCAKNYGKGCTAKYRKKKSKGLRRRKNEKSKPQPQEPQAWITMLWHMGLRLPWSWQLGPSNASERAHVMDMVQTQEFPRKTLFCGDAGFVGYPLWSCLLQRGHDFLVRVGANVSLLASGSPAGRRSSGRGSSCVGRKMSRRRSRHCTCG
jgi:hypothetical protein